MPSLTQPVQVLLIHPIRTWNYYLPVIQKSGAIQCHGTGQITVDIRGVWLRNSGPTDALTVLGLPFHCDLGNWILQQYIQDAPGGNAG